MSAKPQESISGRGEHWEKVEFGHPLPGHYAKNVPVGVVDGARVKGVLGVSVRPRQQGKGVKRAVKMARAESELNQIMAYYSHHSLEGDVVHKVVGAARYMYDHPF